MLNSILILTIISSIFLTPVISQEKPVIRPNWTTSPPSINGAFPMGEWSAPQIIFEAPEYPETYVLPTYAYFLYDYSNLYVMVDAVGDVTNSTEDECLLIFDSNSDPNDGYILIRIKGSSNQATWVKSSNDFEAAIGFGGSPNSPSPHKIYEFAIPLSYINAQPGDSIAFCSPFFKEANSSGSMPLDTGTEYPYRDNIWPIGLGGGDEWKDSADGWGIMSFGSRAVGGYFAPVNKINALIPFLALIGLCGFISSIIGLRRFRKI